MWKRDLFGRWCRRAAIVALVLVILGAGLCCVGQNSMDDHAMAQNLCALVLLVPAIMLPLAGLLPHGLAAGLGRSAFAPVALSVPKPPPRRIRLA
jgi:hypothetical protein